ncbi:MAG: hypothetical protein Q4G40_02815, partial [Brachybacterium sp.]|nr:hypothetical protein [Brachybacterium sp.]
LTTVGPALSRERPEDDPVAADVLAVEAGRSLAHRWGEDVVEWVLDGSHLTVTMRLAAPEYASMYLAGWQVCLAVLVARLEGVGQGRIVGHDAMDHGWEELRARWTEQLGLPDPRPE